MARLKHSALQIIGIDEAGRGAWAGPVVAAAVTIPKPPAGVRDSKLLTAQQRETFYEIIIQEGHVGVGVVPSEEIDILGIKGATNKAMQIALAQILHEDHPIVLIDGNDNFTFDIPYQSFVRGDGFIPSISCASVIAKVTRDRLMQEYGEIFSVYGFGQHKGYGTAQHQEMLGTHGPCAIHRFSYAPIARWRPQN